MMESRKSEAHIKVDVENKFYKAVLGLHMCYVAPTHITHEICVRKYAVIST